MKEKRIQDRPIFKISLLSISLFLMMAPAIATALPLMYHAFKGVSQSGVETLSTIPNIGIVVGLLISPFLVKILGEKATIVTGLVLALIAGTFPMYASSYMPILISRFLLGFGIGFGLSVPYMYNWLDWAAPAGSVNLATTVVLVLVNIGCFISPTVLGMMSSDPKMVLIISGIFFVIFTIYALGHYLNVHKKNVSAEKAE